MPHNTHALALAGILTRSAVQIADTDLAAAMVPERIVAEFTQALLPLSAFARLREAGIPMVLDTFARQVIPILPPADAARSAWVGETGVIPVVNAPIGAEPLNACKIAGISPYSRELDGASASLAGSSVRNILLGDAAAKIDLTLTDNVPAIPQVRPAGLLNGVTATAGVDFATDIDVLIAVAARWRTPMLILDPLQLKSVWSDVVYGPQLANGRLGPFQVNRSENMADPDTVIAVDASCFVGALAVPEIVGSQNTSLTMANADAAPPTQAITAAGVVDTPGQVNPGGGIPITGGPVGVGTANIVAMSMMQMNAIAVRMVEPAAWAMTRSGRVAAISGAAW